MPSMNTNVTVTTKKNANKVTKPDTSMEFEIDLHKETGKGLGIAVTGGPKHVITTGIKVNIFPVVF